MLINVMFWGDCSKVMTFSDVRCDMERQLGRKLQEPEIEFLHWVFNRHQEEQQGESEHATN